MQEMHLFEYAVIRVVPQVEREEFINVGVILYCPDQKFLKTRFELDKERVASFSNKLDIVEIEERLRSFKHICEGRQHGGVIGSLPIASRFRWLTAARSTVLQTSSVHAGLCLDAEAKLDKLLDQLVL